MHSLSILRFILAIFLLAPSCAPTPLPDSPETGTQKPDSDGDSQGNNTLPEGTMTINITAGGKTFTAEIEGSETGKAFVAKLPLTLDMSDLNGNEKYCYGVDLPSADKHFSSIAAGDLMLYSGNCIVLFYSSAGGYSYTRIGKLTSTAGLKDALGPGKVTVTFTKP